MSNFEGSFFMFSESKKNLDLFWKYYSVSTKKLHIKLIEFYFFEKILL